MLLRSTTRQHHAQHNLLLVRSFHPCYTTPVFSVPYCWHPFGVGQRQSSISNGVVEENIQSNPNWPNFLGRKLNLFEAQQKFLGDYEPSTFFGGFPMGNKWCASGHHPPSIFRPVCSYACFQEEYISPLNTPKVDQILRKSGSSLMISCLAKDPYNLTMVSYNNPFISWYYPPKKGTAAVVGTIQILHFSHVEQNLNSNNLWINSAMGARFSALKTLIQPGWNHAMFFQSEETKLDK